MNTLNLLARTAAILLALMFSISANALILEPGDEDATSTENSTLDAGDVAAIFGTSDLSLLYKAEFGGGDEGTFAAYYETLFSNTASDPSNALIEWVGSAPNFITCPECYLVVKDGNQDQYLFDLATWDGMEDLDLRNFYTDQGAISHVAIFGNPSVQVPEPGTLALLGLGLIGLTLTRKNRSAR